MPHIKAYDQDNNEMLLVDTTQQNLSFADNVLGGSFNLEVFIWRLLDILVQKNIIDSTDLSNITSGLELAGYSVVIEQ